MYTAASLNRNMSMTTYCRGRTSKADDFKRGLMRKASDHSLATPYTNSASAFLFAPDKVCGEVKNKISERLTDNNGQVENDMK